MNRFRTQYRPLTEQEKTLVEAIKDSAARLDIYLDGVRDPRMAALARTKLEECVMWAVKGVTG